MGGSPTTAQDNVDARTKKFHIELWNTVQSYASFSVYCQHLKAIADELTSSVT
jgi:hypothetical protein